MTLQVGMIAKDGWVLASDTRSLDLDGLAADDGLLPGMTPKIVRCANNRAIYAFSGNELAHNAGLMFEERLDSILKGHRAAELKRLGEDAHRAPITKLSMAGSRNRLLIIFYGPDQEPSLWSVGIGELGEFSPRQYAIAGGANLAKFFPVAYYESLSDERRTVRNLKRLAAHTICEGHTINPSPVAGLQLFWWTKKNDKAEEADHEEISELSKWSRAIHQGIEDLICRDL
jgi:hypothetical protein